MSRPKTRQGFTLVEMAVTLAVTVTLVGLTIPQIIHWMQYDAPRRAAGTMLSELATARSYALSGYRGGQAAGWDVNSRTVNSGIMVSSANSYSIFVDRNSVTDGDEYIVRQITLPSGMTITSPAVGSEIRFRQNGTMTSSAAFVISNTTLGITRTIGVSGGGLAWLQ